MNTTKIKAIKFKKGKVTKENETVVNDTTLTLTINKKITRNFSVLNDSIKEFITGYLLTEGIINSIEDIKSINIINNETLEGIVEINEIKKSKEKTIQKNKNLNKLLNLNNQEATLCSDASGGLRKKIDPLNNINPINSNLTLSKDEILENMEKITKHAPIWQATGGCHVASIIYKNQSIIKEDVSRHVAVDKVIGAGLYAGFDLKESYIMYSGRMPGDMVIKLVRTNIPILISNTSPSYSGIKIAEKGNITLVGFTRGNRFNVYTNINRIKF